MHAGAWTSGDALSEGIQQLIAAVRTLPMMSPRRVVVVSQAEAMLQPKRESEAAERALDLLKGLLEKPEPMTTLVLVSASLDKRTKIYKTLAASATLVDCGSPVDVASAARWVKTRIEAVKVDIDPQGARLMATKAGFPERPDSKGRTGDIKRLRGEVDRLLLYALGQKKISLDDVLEIVGAQELQSEWGMANAIEAGNVSEALRQLALTFEAGTAKEKILGQIAHVVREKFPFAAPDSLSSAVDSLFRTDHDIKRSAGDPRVLLERLVVELCAGKRARVGARRW